MALTPQEQAEYDALTREDALFQQSQTIRTPQSVVQDFAATGAPMLQQVPAPQMMSVAPQSQPALTPEEGRELQMLEKEEELFNQQQAQVQQQTQQQSQQQEIMSRDEADLGFLRRAQYSLDPMQANREAYLVQEFGKDNVAKNEAGDFLLLQKGEWRPVNKAGISTADVAEFAGAIPEMIGGAGGGVAGALGGMGVGSIPAAAAGLAAGGAAGSAIRQGAAALFTDVPQVASAGERVLEGGLSAGLSVVGGGVGFAAKKAAKPVIRKILRTMPSLKKAAKGIGGMGKSTGESLHTQARRLNLPDLTPSQKIGGKTQELEAVLAESPIFGRRAREAMDAQIQGAHKNIAALVGDFTGEIDDHALGKAVKEAAEKNMKMVKDVSQAIYEDVAEEGRGIYLPDDAVEEIVTGIGKKWGMIDDAGELTSFKSVMTELPADQYVRVQGVIEKVIGDIRRSGDATGGGIDATAMNTIRKFIGNNIKEDPEAADVALGQFKEAMEEATAELMEVQSKGLGTKLREANKLWHQYKNMRDIYQKGGKVRIGKRSVKGLNIDAEAADKTFKSVFSDESKYEALEQLVSKSDLRELAMSHVQKAVQDKTGKLDYIRAGALKGQLNKPGQKGVMIRVLGREGFTRLMDNLDFISKVNIARDVNPSGTTLTKILADVKDGGATWVSHRLALKGAMIKRGVPRKLLRSAEKSKVVAIPKGVVQGVGQDRKRRLSNLKGR